MQKSSKDYASWKLQQAFNSKKTTLEHKVVDSIKATTLHSKSSRTLQPFRTWAEPYYIAYGSYNRKRLAVNCQNRNDAAQSCYNINDASVHSQPSSKTTCCFKHGKHSFMNGRITSMEQLSGRLLLIAEQIHQTVHKSSMPCYRTSPSCLLHHALRNVHNGLP